MTTLESDAATEPATSEPDDDPSFDPSAIEEGLDYRFERPELLRTALTHRSYSNEQDEDANYERLEFLGDSVLGLVTSHWLYQRYPDRPEGDLARLKGYLVSAAVLREVAEDLGIGALLRLGVGERRSGGSAKSSILADAVEAILGAVYIDGGFDAAWEVIEPLLERALTARRYSTAVDSKTVLQEHVQARGWALPVYRLRHESGPDHHKVFTVDCEVEGRVAGTAEGRSKKRAEQRAAAAALEELDLHGDEP